MILAAEVLARWKAHPALMVRQLFGATPDPWQEDVLEAFPHHEMLAMQACKGPGKTTCECWLGWNFTLTRSHPKIICTSITKDNLTDNLWPEFALWQKKAPILQELFTWRKTRIENKKHPETWFISARTWPKQGNKQQQADSLAGVHRDNCMFILDESGGIPDAVMTSAEAALSTGKDVKIVQAGNPTHLSGPLYRACHEERHLWYVVEITGDPDDPKRSTRIRLDWARREIKRWGRDHPWVMVNVLGKFPPASMNTLLGEQEVEDAMGRHLKEDQYKFSESRIGIDPARFGDDANIIFPRQGLAAFPFVELRNVRSGVMVQEILRLKQRRKAESLFMDATGGHGAGVEDGLLTAGHAIIPVIFNGRAIDPKYFNKRAEMWIEMSQWIKRGGSLPKDDGLKRELTTPVYWFDPKGKMRLEEKAQIKSRLGFSPNKADGLAVTFGHPDSFSMGEFSGMHGHSAEVEHDYDPFGEENNG